MVTKYFSGDKIENNEMGGTYGLYRRQEKNIEGFGEET
jgi:hypothetical protein